MCKCTPEMRTPFCGREGCEWPAQVVKDCAHHEFDANVRVARLEDTGGFIAEVRIHCTQCGKPFQFLGLEPGIDTQGARVSIDGLEANIAISPQGVLPNPFQRMAHGVTRFT